MTQSFRDLVVWQQGMDLVVDIYIASSNFPRSEDYALTSQLRRAASSIPSNIAEGSGRRTRNEYVHYLYIARGSMRELETHVEIAVRVGYLARRDITHVFERCTSIGKLLDRLIASVTNTSKRSAQRHENEPH